MTACVFPFSSSVNPASSGLLQRLELFATRSTGLRTSLPLLHYHSLDIPEGPLGAGWTHSAAITLTARPEGSVIVRHGDGTWRVYQPSGSGYRAQAGDYSTLTERLTAGPWWKNQETRRTSLWRAISSSLPTATITA